METKFLARRNLETTSFAIACVLLSFFLLVGLYGCVPGNEPLTGDTPASPSEAEGETTQAPQIGDKWLSLLEDNPELAGWISIENTTIDYPVMQTSDNEKYLRADFYGNYSYFGTPFFDYRCSTNPQSRNLVIYGHATGDGGIFGQLEVYTEQEYTAAHRIIKLNTLYEEQTYSIFAVFKTATKGAVFDYTQCAFDSDAAFMSFISEAQRRSIVELNETVSADDYILTLQTCANEWNGERLVVMAKMCQ